MVARENLECRGRQDTCQKEIQPNMARRQAVQASTYTSVWSVNQGMGHMETRPVMDTREQKARGGRIGCCFRILCDTSTSGCFSLLISSNSISFFHLTYMQTLRPRNTPNTMCWHLVITATHYFQKRFGAIITVTTEPLSNGHHPATMYTLLDVLCILPSPASMCKRMPACARPIGSSFASPHHASIDSCCLGFLVTRSAG